MARHYQVNEFIHDDMLPDPINIAIEKKVSLLYELHVLKKIGASLDAREAKLREALSQYKSERALTIVLHDVVFGNIPLDTFLRRKGLM